MNQLVRRHFAERPPLCHRFQLTEARNKLLAALRGALLGVTAEETGHARRRQQQIAELLLRVRMLPNGFFQLLKLLMHLAQRTLDAIVPFESGLRGLSEYFIHANQRGQAARNAVQRITDRLLVLSPRAAENHSNIGYAIDSIQGAVTLPQLTQAGLDQLMRVSPDKFFMMVEGGSIDHAGHGNDGGTSVREVIAFNDALQIAYDFYLAHPDETLIVVTADHETGGMSVGCQATGYSVRPDKVAAQKVSKEEFNNYCKGIFRSRMVYTWTDMEDYLRENLGFWTAVDLTPAETEELHRMFVEVFENRNQALDDKTLYANFDGFTSEVFKLLNAKAGYGWTSSGHTGSPVPVYAIGVGAQRFSSLNDNTDLPKKIMEIMGRTL